MCSFKCVQHCPGNWHHLKRYRIKSYPLCKDIYICIISRPAIAPGKFACASMYHLGDHWQLRLKVFTWITLWFHSPKANLCYACLSTTVIANRIFLIPMLPQSAAQCFFLNPGWCPYASNLVLKDIPPTQAVQPEVLRCPREVSQRTTYTSHSCCPF